MGCCGASANAKGAYKVTGANATENQGPSAASSTSANDDAGLSAGTRVQIEGLTGAVELNGKTAVVKSRDEATGRYVVELEGAGGQKSLKTANLRPISPTVVSASTKRPAQPEKAAADSANTKRPSQSEKAADATPAMQPAKKEKKDAKMKRASSADDGDFKIGDRVRVGGLNGAIDLNGKLAVVFGRDTPSGRYVVEFENGAGQKKLKADNLTAMGTATGPLAAKARMFAGI
jgi:hypothetical protein